MTLGKKILIPIIALLLVFAAAAPVAMALNQTETRVQPLILALSLQPQTPQQPLPKQYTDVIWTNPTISDENVSQNLNITLNGNLNITETGELHLIHCIINLNNGTTPVEYGIKVYGKMYINVSSTITAINTSNPYYFTVYEGATFQMNDSRVEYCGHEDGAWPDESGLTIRADNTWIENNTITQCRHAIILYQSDGSTILNNTAMDNYLGFYLESSSNNNLTDNKAKNNGWEGFYLRDCVDNDLTGNTATNNYYGFRLFNNLLDGNNLTGNIAINNNYGFHLSASRYNTLMGNTALNCTTGYYLFSSTNNDFTGSVEANYLRVNVTTALGEPIQGADVEVETDGTQVYATPYFLGTDDTTDSNGLTPWIDVPYRTFTGPTTMTENTTTVEVWNSPFTFLNNPRTVNMSVSHMETFQITGEDLYPPVTTISLSGTAGLEGWYTSNVTVTLTAIDDVSGVNKTEYSYDNDTWYEYTEPFIISTEGIKTVYYNSTDNMDRVEATKNATIKIDKTDPTTTIDLTGTTVGEWYTSDVTVNLTATDAAPGSGIAHTYYRINGSIWTEYTDVIPLTTDGIFTIDYYSVDVAGNEETAKSEIVKLDKATPVTTIDLIGTSGQGGWYLSNVTVNLTATDSVSGVAEIAYSYDGTNWTPYTAPFTIFEEGIKTVYYNSTDNVGRVENTNIIEVKIDKTPPETTISLSGTLGLNDWYISEVQVTLTVTDGISNVFETAYSYDGDTWSTYPGPFNITLEGTITLYYNSTDNAGNVEETNTIIIKIDRTSPDITITAPSDGAILPTDDVQVNWTGSDNIGIYQYEVQIDSEGWIPVEIDENYLFNNLSENSHTVYVKGVDLAGNEDIESVSFTVDMTPPTVTIDSPSPGDILSSEDVTVNWTGSDTVGINYYEVQVDGEGWIDVGINENYLFNNLDDGYHTAEVRAFDQAGNSNTTSVSFTVDTTPPTVDITAPSDGAVFSIDSVEVNWTGSDATTSINHYEVQVDGEGWIDVGINENYLFNNLDDGYHTAEVRAFDQAGNSNTTSVSFTVDTTPPTVDITAPSDGAILPTRDITVNWTGDDNIALDHYKIRIDGGSWVDKGLSESHNFSNLDNGLHIVYVMAFDGAGNTNTSTVSFTVDTEEPDVTITSPGDGALLTSGDVTVYWTSVATDVAYYNISIDGGDWINVGLNYNHLIPGLSDNPHNVEVMAVDEAGLNDSDTVSFTVDTAPPTVTITAPSDGAFLSSGDLTVNWTGSDATSGIGYFEIRIDGGGWENMGTSKSKTYSGLPEGPYTVEVVAYDNAGLSDSDTVSFTVDTSSPTVTITDPVDGAFSPVDNVDVIWTGSDAITSIDYFEIRIDGGGWEYMGTSKSKTYSGLPEGPYTVEVRAFDQVGNNNTDTVSFTVDTTPPTVSITSPIPDEEFNTKTVTVNWTRDDTNFDYCMYRLDGGSWHNVGSETSHIFKRLSNGSHTVEIRAVDQAGHNSTDTVSFIVNIPVSPSVIPVLVSLSLMQQQGVPMVYLMVGGLTIGIVLAVGLVLWLRRRP